MSNKVIDFPQYRKLLNDKVYYKIISEKEFDEIQIVGGRAKMFTVNAVQYPEILLIQDLCSLEHEGYALSDKEEFQEILNRYSL